MPDRKLVVYVAGPFRGANAWEIAENIRRAERLALDVWKMGAVAICPHLNTANFQDTCPDDVWLDGDLELVRRSDIVLMTPDWRRSAGARAEHTFANDCRITVVYTLDQLAAHLQHTKPIEMTRDLLYST